MTLSRDCPRCRTGLQATTVDGRWRKVELDACPACQGVFLDKNELVKLTGHKNVNRLITEYLGVDVGSDLVCPGCGGLMDDEHFHGAEGAVTIDVCTHCMGVWLDDGELEAIAKLDDGAFRDVPPDKRAEAFDADMLQERRDRGGNLLQRAFADVAQVIREGTRRLR